MMGTSLPAQAYANGAGYGYFYCSKEFKLAYLAIRKCASNSVAAWIARLKTDDVRIPMWDPSNRSHNFDIVTPNDAVVEEFFKFTVVRHPFTRFLSFYNNWIVNPPHTGVLENYVAYGMSQNMPKRECIECLVKVPRSGLEAHTRRLVDHVYKDGRLRINAVFKAESLIDDFKVVQELTNIYAPLGFMNKRHPKLTLDDCEKELLFDYYCDDFTTFGYEK